MRQPQLKPCVLFNRSVLAGDKERDCDHCLVVSLIYLVSSKQMLKAQDMFGLLSGGIGLGAR
jgi:hypothetical protein